MATLPSSNRGRYLPAPYITDTAQLSGLKSGQWVQLAWLDRPSRFVRWTPRHVTAFHGPGASLRYRQYLEATKEGDAFASAAKERRRIAAVA